MKHNITLLKNLDILFVEDDEVMLKNTISTLEIFFKNVYSATNVQDALELYQIKKPNILLSDIKLEKESGLQLAKYIREKDYTIPIVMLTSYSDQKYLLEAANIGIDGYLIKPLELNNIIETFLKAIRKIPHINSIINLTHTLKYHYFKKELTTHNRIIELGEKESMLFDFFIDNANKTISKKEIVYHIWPLDDVTDSAFKNLLSRLRAKIGEDIIQTVKNKGWILYVNN